MLVTVTLYLDYLLFRYFQYAFHPDVFSIWRKSTEEIHTILYVLGRTLSINERRKTVFLFNGFDNCCAPILTMDGVHLFIEGILYGQYEDSIIDQYGK